MGQLLSLASIKANLGSHWYFTSEVKLPNDEYPHTLFILREKMSKQDSIDIRKFVQSSCEDTVIVDTVHRTYRSYTYMKGGRWDWYSREIDWSHESFYLQTEEEALMFKLRFSELVSEFTEYDPEHPPAHIQETEHKVEELEKRAAWALPELYNKTKNSEDPEIQPLPQETIDHLVKAAADWKEHDPIQFVDADGNKFKHLKLENYIRLLRSIQVEKQRLANFLEKPFKNGNGY